ncbi:MAG: WD40/YVTN/BNR-like repeat-containing protein [Candidatus Binatia bacterium]
MRRFLCAIAVAISAVTLARPSRAGERVSAAVLRQNLFSACFQNDQEGWVVGDLGRIFHTTDGAKTWHIQSAGNATRSFVSLACPDEGDLWAAGQAGEIAHSADAGTTWTLQRSSTNRQLLGVAFGNRQRGLAVGDFGVMLRTGDGGATWAKVPFPQGVTLPPDVAEVVDPGDVVLYAVSFADPEHAWIVGEFGVILASSDGGLTWHAQDSPVQTSLFGVFFADQQRGWAVGLEATLLQTTDGGRTWRKVHVESPYGFALALYGVQVRGNYGWAVGNSGFLLNSKDAGATWQLVNVPVQLRSSWFRDMSLLPDGRGYIVGAKGLVLAADRDRFTPSKVRF